MQEEIIYGKNNVLESINNQDITKVYLLKEGSHKEIVDLVSKKKIPYVFTDRYQLNKMTKNGAHQGVVAITSPAKYLELSELIDKNSHVKNPLILLYDELQDPNNLGAIMRVMDAFLINGIVFNKRRNVQLTASVAKISTGAINHVDTVRVTNLSQSIKQLKKTGYWIAYLDMDGETEVRDFDFNIPLVVIVGGEDKGVTDNLKKHSDFSLSISMKGHVNSLNVACATSILCYHKSIS